MSQFLVFTDGAASGNPGPGGWGVVVVRPDDWVVELGGSEASVTNNAMELKAAIEALAYLGQKPSAKVRIHTDSKYVIQGITSWIQGWKKNGWQTKQGKSVVNRVYWEVLDRQVTQFPKRLEWIHSPAHRGIPGNERADQIAVEFAESKSVQLYDGPLGKYPVDLASKETTHASGPIYISLVGGEVQTHETWKDCEKRVKGKSGAKFKKVKYPGDEKKILKEWGVSE